MNQIDRNASRHCTILRFHKTLLYIRVVLVFSKSHDAHRFHRLLCMHTGRSTGRWLCRGLFIVAPPQFVGRLLQVLCPDSSATPLEDQAANASQACLSRVTAGAIQAIQATPARRVTTLPRAQPDSASLTGYPDSTLRHSWTNLLSIRLVDECADTMVHYAAEAHGMCFQLKISRFAQETPAFPAHLAGMGPGARAYQVGSRLYPFLAVRAPLEGIRIHSRS